MNKNGCQLLYFLNQIFNFSTKQIAGITAILLSLTADKYCTITMTLGYLFTEKKMLHKFQDFKLFCIPLFFFSFPTFFLFISWRAYKYTVLYVNNQTNVCSIVLMLYKENSDVNYESSFFFFLSFSFLRLGQVLGGGTYVHQCSALVPLLNAVHSDRNSASCDSSSGLFFCSFIFNKGGPM